MTFVVECPRCGGYVSERDGFEETTVEEEVCKRCLRADDEFDEGLAGHEESLRIDREDEMNLGPF